MTSPDGHSPAVAATNAAPVASAEAIAGAFVDPAVMVDAGGRLLAANAAAAERLGLGAETVGRTLADAGLASHVADALRLPLADPAGAAVLVWRAAGALGADIVALQVARVLSRLAPGIAHDHRNQVMGFKSFGGLLRTDDAAMAEYGEALIGMFEVNADRAGRLVDAFTSLARERAPAPRAIAISAAVERALHLVEFQLLDVNLTVGLPIDLPEVRADSARLHRALAAILVNALDGLGSPKATGALRISGDPSSADASVLEIVVADDGPTVPEADREHLFDVEPPSGVSTRAGLDLAVARRLVEADGGTLRYEPPADGGAGRGNRLIVRLPLAVPLEPVRQATRATAATTDARPVTVLVCDDDDAVRGLIGRVLERTGMRVLGAASGSEALAVLDRETIDVVMSDHGMHGMDGVELHAAASGRYPAVASRFILMSGDAGRAELDAFANATGLCVLAKPFELASLPALVRRVAQG
jgi:signal transduction histidine kinase